jgi:catechol 2,3-dioxygenase-like lactoylglutathione lyase family enzyme
MFTYVSLGASDLERAARFYDATLATLGLRRCVTESELDDWIGWGTYEDDGRRQSALWLCKPFNEQPASAGNGTMVALLARSWSQVDSFYQAALRAGGSSEGPPGLRPQYNDDFYAAYVRDPDGNKIAAVCRGFTSRGQSDAAS